MNVILRPDLEKFVEEKVRTGQYAHPNDVLNGALDLLREQEDQSEEDTEDVRRKIDSGLAQLARGEGTEWDVEEVKSAGRRLFAERMKKD